MSNCPARWAATALLPLALALLSGCVERTMIINTWPAGAIVFDERNVPLSASPADKSFTYYGKYRFTLVKDGYETLVVEEDIAAPWYEYGFLEFISENLVPWTIRDVRRLNYELKPLRIFPTDAVLEQGKPLRAKGQTLGEPLPPEVRPTQQAPSPPPSIIGNPNSLPPLLPPAKWCYLLPRIFSVLSKLRNSPRQICRLFQLHSHSTTVARSASLTTATR
jgi:hypothetical protein